MKGALAFAAVLSALWLALFGLAALILGYAVVEVLCVELAGVVLAVIGGALLVLDRPSAVSAEGEPVPQCARCEAAFQRALAHLDTA